MTRRVAWLVAACLAGCGDDGVPPIPAEASIEIGSGQAEFVAVEDGATVDLVFGCQGGQHIWIALRMRNMNPRSAIVELVMERASDATIVSIPFTVRTTFEPDPTGSYYDIWGLTLQATGVDAVVEQDVVVHARVMDLGGLTSEATKPLHVRMGASACPRALDGGVALDGGDGSVGPTSDGAASPAD